MSAEMISARRKTIQAMSLLLAVAVSVMGEEASKTQNPIGTWRGQSTCVVRPSACHDEEALYHVSSAGQPDRVIVGASKIVNSEEIRMGSGECRYAAERHTIDCPLPNGNDVHLEVNGDLLEGTMTLRDGTLWRKISLRRAKEK